MKKRCLNCGERDAEGCGLINLEFKGVSVRVLKEEKTQCEECFTKRFAGYLAKYRNLFKVVDGKMVFDWKTFCEKYENEECDRIQVVEMLIGLEFLSKKCNGNYEIMSSNGIVINPKFCMSYVWFINYDDATCYATAKYANTEYLWHVRRIMGVWNKQEIIEREYEKNNQKEKS